MANALVPELSVSDWRHSCGFYCNLIGFSVLYQRPEEGFAYLALGTAELMLDQLGIGRDFDLLDMPPAYPFGRGVNLQILVPALDPIIERLRAVGISPYLPVEDKWYRRDTIETGNRQCVVADPDGYLLRLFEDLGERPLTADAP